MRTTQHRLLCIATLAVTLGCISPALGADSDWAWNYNLFLGRRYINDNDWTPFSTYQQLGVEATWGKAEEPLLWATDFYVAQETEHQNGFSVDSNAWELDLGLRKTWTLKKRFNISFGTGPALVYESVEFVSHRQIESSDDKAYGWFFGGNFFYRISSQLNLGIALHFTPTSDMKVNGTIRPGGSTNLGLIIGWGAPLAPEK